MTESESKKAKTEGVNNKTTLKAAKDTPNDYTSPLLDMPQPFWETFYEYLPKNNFYKTCKRAIKIQQTHNDTLVVDVDNNLNLIPVRHSLNLDYLVKYYPNLQNLTLSGFNLLNNERFAGQHTQYLTRLKRLDLSNCAIFGPKLFMEPWCKYLISLNLSNSDWHYDYISEDYEMGFRPKVFDLRGISKCCRLQELSLGGYICLKGEDLREICQMTRLVKLNISQFLEYEDIPNGLKERYCFQQADVEELTRLECLEDLSMACCVQIEETGFGWLAKMTNLKTLDLSKTRIDHRGGGFQALRKLTSLRNLGIAENMSRSINAEHFEDFINALGSLTQIRHICIPGTCHTNPDEIVFPRWEALKSLQSLCVAGWDRDIGNQMPAILENPNIKKIHLFEPTLLNVELTRPVELCGECKATYFYIGV